MINTVFTLAGAVMWLLAGFALGLACAAFLRAGKGEE